MTMPLRLEPLMEKRGLNAYRLAKLLEGRMTSASVYRLVAGDKVKLSADEVDLLCEVLAASPNQLFGYRKGKG
jgi:DNA-binding Xre family transcriptional regulator